LKSILDPTFVYTPAVKTDLRETFRRVRAEQAQAAEREQADKAEAAQKVAPISKGRK
jgi:hypothetical protein